MELLDLIQHVHVSHHLDKFWWGLDNTGEFSVSGCRKQIDSLKLVGGAVATTWYKTLPRRVNIFLWRCVLDRLPTRFNLSKRGMELSDIGCPNCCSGGETLTHLIFMCGLAREVWAKVARWCGLVWSTSSSIKEWLTWVDTQHIPAEKRVRVKIIIITTWWILWRYRNAVVFEGDKIRKSSIFDMIVSYSFRWLNNRDSNSCVVWNSWLIYPL